MGSIVHGGSMGGIVHWGGMDDWGNSVRDLEEKQTVLIYLVAVDRSMADGRIFRFQITL